ncbi:MAG TPA: DUF1843 domain-containing protein [Thermoanaerobaculia bacterium]|nr:DUF1843 domain-containing protein [Thermoanaerobaculia bacterium]
MAMRPYGNAISDAVERGDARRLESLVNQAKQLHEKQGGDLSKAIRAGEAALKKLEKGPARPATKKAPAKKK